MARRIKKRSKFLPPKDLVDRRLRTLVALMRKEAELRMGKKTRPGMLTPIEMIEWANQCERVL